MLQQEWEDHPTTTSLQPGWKESKMSENTGRVAQLVERHPEEMSVAGSIPVLATLKRYCNKHLIGWSPFDEGDLRLGESHLGHYYICFRTVQTPPLNDTTHFDVNIIDDVFYLLDIELEPRHKGKGLGLQLYEALENIARDLGCTRIEQTPSGWTHSGETRASYLQRHGYTLKGRVAIKEF